MEGDPLADVLTLASARCVRIGTLKAGGTWALKFPPPEKIKLIAVVKGGCWLAVDGERTPLRLQTGEVFMVPAARSCRETGPRCGTGVGRESHRAPSPE